MDPFSTLGLPRDYALDSSEIERRYRDLQRALHPDRFVNASPSERRISLSKAVEVNEAYRILKDDVRRGESLLSLLGHQAADSAADPELLMEVMELREALSEAKHARDLPSVRKLASQVNAQASSVSQELVAAFAKAVGEAPAAAQAAPPSFANAAALLSRLKYYRRFFDEVNVIEEEAGG